MKKLLCILSFFITFLSCILIMIVHWIHNTFGAIRFETIMFTFATPMKEADHRIISSFILDVIILSFILTILLFIPFILYHYRVKINTFLHNIYIYIYILTSNKKAYFIALYNLF